MRFGVCEQLVQVFVGASELGQLDLEINLVLKAAQKVHKVANGRVTLQYRLASFLHSRHQSGTIRTGCRCAAALVAFELQLDELVLVICSLELSIELVDLLLSLPLKMKY